MKTRSRGWEWFTLGSEGIIFGLQPAAVLAVPLSIAGVLIALRRPLLICLAFTGFSYFRFHEVFQQLSALRLPLVLGVFSCVAFSWHLVIARSVTAKGSRLLFLLLLFFAVVTAGIPFAADRHLAWAYWSEHFSKIVLITVVLSWLVRCRSDLDLVSRAIAGGGLILAAVIISNAYQGVGLVEKTRATLGTGPLSVLGDPNDIALLMLLPLAFSLAIFQHTSNHLVKIFGLFAGLVILLAIIYTQSRGGLLGVVAVMGVIGARVFRAKWRLLAALVAIAIVLHSAMDITDRISGGASEPGLDESAAGRLDMWKAAANMALRHPIFGVGLGNFAANMFDYTDSFPGRDLGAHSTWFQVLGETGIPGFAIFVLLIFRTSASTLRNKRLAVDPSFATAATGTLAALSGFIVAGSFLSHAFTWPFYVILAIVMATERQLPQPTQELLCAPGRC